MKISFKEIENFPSDADIRALELRIGFGLPAVVKEWFMLYNDGVPDPFLLRVSNYVDTEVSFLLSLGAQSDGPLVGDVYFKFMEFQRVPFGFLPFAVDAGGDYFFVNCIDANSPTFFYDSHVNAQLIDLERSFEGFWDSLEIE